MGGRDLILWKSPENLNTLFFDKRMFAVLTNLRKSASSKHPRRSGTPPRIRSSLEGGAFEVPPPAVRTAFFHPFFFSMRSISTIQSDAKKVTTSCGLTTPQPQYLVFCTDFTPEKWRPEQRSKAMGERVLQAGEGGGSRTRGGAPAQDVGKGVRRRARAAAKTDVKKAAPSREESARPVAPDSA